MQTLLHAAQHGALIVSRPDLATLEVLGPDRTSWLNAVVTNDLAPLARRAAVFTLALSKKGKLLADSFVLSLPDRLLLSVDPLAAPDLLAHLNHFLVMEDAEIRLSHEAFSWALVLGPSAFAALDLARSLTGVAAAVPVAFSDTDAGLLLLQPNAERAVLESLAASRPHVATASLETFDLLRIDLGIPRFPLDYGSDTYPQEAGLDTRAVSFNKGCYLGQEIVVKMRSRGHPARTLVRVHLPGGSPVPDPKTPVCNLVGEVIGAITSASLSLLTPGVCAFANVRWSQGTVGSPVVVGQHEGRILPLVA